MVTSNLFAALDKEASALIIPILYIMFGLFLILITRLILKWQKKKEKGLPLDKKDLFLISIEIISFLILRAMLVKPQFITYTDEGYYVWQGRRILEKGIFPIVFTSRTLGWSMLIAFALLLHYSMSSVFVLNQLLMIGGSILLYLLVKEFSKDRLIALLAGTFFLFNPGGFFWSATADNFAAAAFFLVGFFLFFYYYLRNREEKLIFYIAAWFLSYSVLIRRELIILFLPLCSMMLFLWFKSKERGESKLKGTKKEWLWILLMLILIFPQWLHEFEYCNQPDLLIKESQGEFNNKPFSLANFIYNTKTFLPLFFEREYFPLALTILSLFSMAVLIIAPEEYKDDKREMTLVLILSFLSLIFIYFFSWFQTLGGSMLYWVKTKFLWLMSIPLIILSSIGIRDIFYLINERKWRTIIKIGVIGGILLSFMFPIEEIGKYFNQDVFQLQFKLTDEINAYLKSHNMTNHTITTPFPELIPLTKNAKRPSKFESPKDLLLFDFSCNIDSKSCDALKYRRGKLIKRFKKDTAVYELYSSK